MSRVNQSFSVGGWSLSPICQFGDGGRENENNSVQRCADEFADLEGEQRLDLAILPRSFLHLSTTELTMSASKSLPDIIQEGEKNPRGIPKALFIVRSLRRFLSGLVSTPPFRLPSRCRPHIIVDCRRTFSFSERRGRISKWLGYGHRKGTQRFPGCPSVRVVSQSAVLLV